MGKGKPAKSKPPTAQKGGASSSVLKHAPLLLLAVAVQLLLTWGYFQWQADPQAPPSGDAPPQASASAPTRCPDDWSDCPAVPGADWAALAALEAEAEAPTEEQLASCDAADILSSQRVPGMHLLCVVPSAAGGRLGVAVYRDMLKGHPAQLLLLPPTLAAAEHLVAAIEHKLQVPARQNPLSQPGALFTDAGIRMKRTRKLTGMRRAIMTEGGQWLWPPGEVGHVHPLPGLVAPGIETRVVTLSIRPLVVEIENFLTTEEAAHIVARAKPHMEKSGVALKDADVGKAAKEFRTSSQYFLPTTNDDVLERVDERVQLLTRLPISHAEYIQVLKYEHMEHYSAHHDFFNPREYASNPQMLREVENGAKNRLATVFFYLNNVSKGGGQTNFPRAHTPAQRDGGAPVRDYFDCSRGLSVFPLEGKVIIFYSMLPNGQTDEYSLHGGCDVLDGSETKWSANFWLWNKPYHFISAARKKMVQRLQAKWL